MNDAARVRRRQGVGNLNPDPQSALQLQRPSIAKLADVLAFDELHGDEVQALRLVHIEDGADVRMVQSGSEPGLALESFQVGFFDSEFGRQDFENNRAPEFLIDSFVNRALSARADLLSDLVVAEELPDHRARILVQKWSQYHLRQEMGLKNPC